jgi:hypothetical protein
MKAGQEEMLAKMEATHRRAEDQERENEFVAGRNIGVSKKDRG